MLISNALTALSLLSLASAAAIPDANIEERAASTVDAGFKAKGKRFVSLQTTYWNLSMLISVKVLGNCWRPWHPQQSTALKHCKATLWPDHS